MGLVDAKIRSSEKDLPVQQRMGVVIVGPSGSGKTTLFTILKHALSSLGKSVKQHTMNPKAIPRTQLLGHIDLDTR